ncbi:MAG: hypothetical protein AVDCRST_MAG76-196 [uncultured Acidimicrobiales bacterium]|uniref:Uncharacterized protein n=1 Tax=uncultured Acidimicrobiales bacterium TaxID=310071 RepID=A0A6J4H655_9ACTN|nr:MAG: hypothetical protein AVDCRST_MAG76-196 [uncultured Acidimicrobiales bacterium]
MERRFFNPSQPQTMQVAVFLLYANVVIGLLFRTGNQGEFILSAWALIRSPDGLDTARLLGNILAIVFIVGSAACAYLIANEKRIGWKAGVAVAAAPLVASAIIVIIGYPRRTSLVDVIDIGLLFDVALLALLLHTQTRSYEKIWFK